jgi:hypothetical protein
MSKLLGRWFGPTAQSVERPLFEIATGLHKSSLPTVHSRVRDILTRQDGRLSALFETGERLADGTPRRQLRLRELSPTCDPGPSTLCLGGGRFRVEVNWANFQEKEGFATAQPLSDETGYFTFFNPDNVELVVKVLNGKAHNGNFWVFYGALSNVEYRLVVTDTEQGIQKVYYNPPRAFASVGDTAAFPGAAQLPAEPATEASAQKLSPAEIAALLPGLPADGHGLAVADESDETLAFQGGRFQASIDWKDFKGRTGTGRGATLTEDTGYFWFFRPENVEVVLKVLDGRAKNGHWWVFYGALSNVEYTLSLEDTQAGTAKTYFNPLRTFASAGDTKAFAD